MRIFETLNKAILASWEKCILTGGTEAVAMAQAALLGQTFALLSSVSYLSPRHADNVARLTIIKRKKDLLIAQTFHGTLIAWARRLDVFRVTCIPEKIDVHGAANGLRQTWKKWIQREERNRKSPVVRVAAALFIHDVEIAEISMSDRFLRHKASDLPPACDEDLWSAPIAEVWAERFKEVSASGPSKTDYSCSTQQAPVTFGGVYQHQGSIAAKDCFRSYIVLSGLASFPKETHNYEALNRERQREQKTRFLINFYTSHIEPSKEGSHDVYLRRALWHSTFISSDVNMDRLEIAIGREGYNESQQRINDVREWACSLDGQRCALHAIMILRELEKIVLGTEPPIHIPRTVFCAAITWFCYIKLGRDGPDLSQHDLEFPEFKVMGVNCYQILFEANGYKGKRLKSTESSVFRGFIDLLQRVGHWGISNTLASILRLLLPEGTDDEKNRF
ncbi:hypothetical protein N7478_006685 [Penicillium angulare]|uniref:uncharacterized protein n=1 Tax=Penicillium angulare TaxID=116970 RepID=UPI00253FEBFF|nr:uncharacterized protein N7478_006685 [Penicillium angulare]KAJ5281313.1 hypothetical protein N7478_006685 [Penicillium angulare]